MKNGAVYLEIYSTLVKMSQMAAASFELGPLQSTLGVWCTAIFFSMLLMKSAADGAAS